MDDSLVASRLAPDAPLRLSIAAKLAFPDGSMTASGLRREALRGRLQVERIAGKDYTTLEAINEMRKLCRVQARELGSTSVSRRYRDGKLVAQAVWIIKDGDRHIATGCLASASGTKPPREAEQALSDYIASKYQPERRRRDIEEIDCADVLSIYLADIGEPGEQHEIEPRIERLNEYLGWQDAGAS